ncbi:MAG TPA: hypothetical protein VLE97_08940 [Gaiellaceae bacterium]|nr:hypothetical protein [Gaiellaceae bacterium]
MKPSKKKKLESAGYKVGSGDDFLGLSAAESQQVADQVGSAAALPPCMLSLRIPKDWTLEPLERLPDYALLSTPPPRRYMATVDFKHRGVRSGYSTTGRYLGEEWNKPRKKYVGRAWRQQLLDDAIAHLAEVL